MSIYSSELFERLDHPDKVAEWMRGADPVSRDAGVIELAEQAQARQAEGGSTEIYDRAIGIYKGIVGDGQVLANERQAAWTLRQARRDQVGRWERLLDEQGGGFRSVLEMEGIADDYTAAQARQGPGLRQQVRRDLFVQDLTGATAEEMATGIPRRLVAKDVLGIEDPSDEAFDKAMRGHVQRLVNRRSIDRKTQERVVADVLLGRYGGPGAYGSIAAEVDGTAEERAANRSVAVRTKAWIEQAYSRQARELIPGMVAAAMAEGMDQTDQVATVGLSRDEWLTRYGRLTAKQRDEVWELLSVVTKTEGIEIESDLGPIARVLVGGTDPAKMMAELKRSGRKIAANWGTFSNREAERRAREIVEERKVRLEGAELAAAMREASAGGELNMFRAEPATPEEIAEAQRVLGWFRAVGDLQEASRLLRQAEGRGFWEKAGNVAAGSVPHMIGFMAGPVGATATVASYTEDYTRQIEREHPDTPPEVAQLVGSTAGMIEGTLNQVGFTFLGFGKGTPVKSATGAFVKRAVAGWSGETGTEMLQEFSDDAARTIWQAVDGAPEAEFAETWAGLKENAGPMAVGLLPFALVGAGATTISDARLAKEIDWQLQDQDMLRAQGYGETQAQEIMAQPTPLARLEKALALYEGRDGGKVDEDTKARVERKLEARSEKSEADEKPARPVLEVRREEDGSWTVRTEGKPTESYADAQSASRAAEEAALAALSEAESTRKQATREQLEYLADYHQSTGKKVTTEEVTALNLADLEAAGVATRQELEDAVRVWLDQQGETVPDTIALSDYEAEGMATLQKRTAGWAVTLAEGAAPETATEEHSEGFLKDAVRLGVTDYKTVLEQLEAFQNAEGVRLVGTEGSAERRAVEGFSALAKGMVMAELDSRRGQQLPESLRDWAEQARGLVDAIRRGGLGKELRALLDVFLAAFRAAVKTAAAIVQGREKGTLDKSLERLALQAVGLDEDYQRAAVERQAAGEIREESSFKGHPVVAQIKAEGGMVSKSAAQKKYGKKKAQGLAALWDGAPRMDPGKNREIYNPDSSILPDQMAQMLYDHEGDDGTHEPLIPEPTTNALWEAIEEAKGGKFGPGSFSLRATVVNGSGAKVYHTPQGTVIGPATFKIRALHTSPHKVEGGLSTDWIGTGEGNQAFGWGLYAAENEAVAGRGGHYDMLFRKRTRNIPENLQRFEEFTKWLFIEQAKAGYDVRHSGEAEAAAAKHGFSRPPALTDAAYHKFAWQREALAAYETDWQAWEAANGFEEYREWKPELPNVYGLLIDADPSELLDWDKPLGQQSPFVREAWMRAYKKRMRYDHDPTIEDWVTGQGMYEMMVGGPADAAEYAKRASMALLAEGIKGIRFLDGFSRYNAQQWVVRNEKGEIVFSSREEQDAIDYINDAGPEYDYTYSQETRGTYNYVVFDGKYIDIVEENGEPLEEGPSFALARSGRIGDVGGIKQESSASGEDSASRSQAEIESRDAAYLAAVESGDMETAARLVEEAAEEAVSNRMEPIDGLEKTEAQQDQARIDALMALYGPDEASIPWDEQPALLKTPDDKLRDGHHRLEAFWRLGYTQAKVITVPLEVYESIGDQANIDPLIAWASEVTNDFHTGGQQGVTSYVGVEPELDTVKRDNDGNIIPLSKRFPLHEASAPDVSSGATMALRKAGVGPVDAAIEEAMGRGPEEQLKLFEAIRERVGRAKDRITLEQAQRKGRKTAKVEAMNQMALAMGQLQAMLGALPPDVRARALTVSYYNREGKKLEGQVPVFTKLAQLDNDEQIEAVLVAMVGRIERAVESHLVRLYRDRIKRQLKQGLVAKTPKGGPRAKMTSYGHDMFKRVRDVMAMTVPELEAAQEATQARIDKDQWDNEVEEMVERSMPLIYAMFGNYMQQNSSALKEGYEHLQELYRVERGNLLDKLTAKKQWRARALGKLKEAMGLNPDDPVTDRMANAEHTGVKAAAKRADIAVHAMLGDFGAIMEMLGEPTGNADRVKDLLKAVRDAANDEQDRNEASEKALDDKLRELAGGGAVAAENLRWRLNERRTDHGVTYLEGRESVRATIPLDQVPDIVDGTRKKAVIKAEDPESGRMVEREMDVDDETRQMITRAWEKHEDLPEDVKRRKKVLEYYHTFAAGKRVDMAPDGRSELELLYLKLLLDQPDLQGKLQRAGYDEVTRRDIELFLSPEAIELGQWMVEQLREAGTDMRRVFRETRNLSLPNVDRYFPAMFEPAVGGSPESADAKLENETQRKGVGGGFLLERQHHSAPPRRENALAVFQAHMADANHYISHAEMADTWGRLMKDRATTRAIRAVHGKEMVTAITKWWDQIESGYSVQGTIRTALDRMIRALKNGSTLGILGGRVSTLLVQASGTLNPLASLPPHKILAGMASAMKHGFRLKEVWDTPAMKRRVQAGNYAVQASRAPRYMDRPIFALSRRLAEKGMLPIQWMDGLSNTLTAGVVYQYHYDQAKKARMSDADAHRAAEVELDQALARYAQPTQKQNMSLLEHGLRQHPLAEYFVRFFSEPRQKAFLSYQALRKALTGKGRGTRAEAAWRVFLYVLVYELMEELMRALWQEVTSEDDPNKGLDRLANPENWGRKWTYDLTVGRLEPLPVVGQAVEYTAKSAMGLDTYASTDSTALRAAMDLSRVRKALQDGEDMSADQISVLIGDAMQAGGSLHPSTAVLSQAGNVAESLERLYHYAGRERFLSDEERWKDMMQDYRALDDDLPSLEGLKGQERKDALETRETERETLLRARMEVDGLSEEQQVEFLQWAGDKLPKGLRERMGATE